MRGLIRSLLASALLVCLFPPAASLSPTAGKWAIKLAGGGQGVRGSRAARLERSLRSLGVFMESHPLEQDYYLLSDLNREALSASQEEMEELLSQFEEVEWFELQVPKVRAKRAFFQDPLYDKQWHLENEGNDISVLPVWLQGFNGTGVTVAMVDDGLDYTHNDLAPNYNPAGSYDFNRGDADPMPTVDSDNHGTRCAGEISAVANNSVCGVGVAFNSKISGITLISDAPTDADEGSALSFKMNINHIYSNSWGPNDDGKTLEGPGKLAKEAFKKGVTEGRRGLGSIYIFASGNGASNGDDCNFDGYANSIYTIAIGAITDGNTVASYSEGCSALIAVTYSSGGKAGIATTDLRQQCTTRHSGTSAAAPIAAGMAALALSARPNLTWRDMQHLFIQSTEQVFPSDSSWKTNGAGLKIHPRMGFGSLNATKLIENALGWTSVGKAFTFSSGKMHVNLEIEKGANALRVGFETPANSTELPRRLEHVEVIVTITHEYRGMLEISLISPMGTPSMLAPQRLSDRSANGYRDWTFVTVRNWGEDPEGTWALRIKDNSGLEIWTGRLQSWEIIFHGTGAKEQQVEVTVRWNVPLLVAICSVSVIIVSFLLFLGIRAFRRSRSQREANNQQVMLSESADLAEGAQFPGEKEKKEKKKEKKERGFKRLGRKASKSKEQLRREEEEGNESLDDEQVGDDEHFTTLRDRLNVDEIEMEMDLGAREDSRGEP